MTQQSGMPQGTPTGKIRAVLFDLDDTLVSSVRVKWEHMKAVAHEQYGLTIDDDMLRAQWGRPLLDQVMALFGSVDTPESVYGHLADAVERFPKVALPGAVEVVEQLLGQGVRVGVVTSAPGGYARDDLLRLGFPLDRLTFVFGEEDLSHHKPDPRAFEPGLELLGNMGIAPSEVGYIGDLPVDFEAAVSAELFFVAVATGLYSADELVSFGVAPVERSLARAVQLLLTSGAEQRAHHVSDGRV